MPSTTITRSSRMVRRSLPLARNIHYQSTPEQLIQDTLRRGEGMLNDTGALIITTGQFTGRSPKDKFIVKDSCIENDMDWNGFNNPLDPSYFPKIFKKVIDYLHKCPEIWVRDAYACADEHFRMNIRIINEQPAGNLFAYNMFLRPGKAELENFEPAWHVFVAPGLQLNPAECGVRQKNAAVISFKHRMILIAGTGYTGEIKKGIFTVLNYLMPQKHHVLSMHCSANMGADGDTALFFGLSGTGKTTLSADPARKLIGDDEHGWTASNIFNFEGGCYAKVIGLKEEKEPEIFHAIREGALLENTVCFPGTSKIDFDASCITENTRVSYPLEYIPNAIQPSIGNVPSNIFFLTCDAYGVLPPISKLTTEQAMYQFISGYTAKVAGTETGICEPSSTFSACFGAPFIPLHPSKYAEMLGQKLKEHSVNVWLINTGWTGGAYGTGQRISLSHTRAMIHAVLEGQLQNVPFAELPVFGFSIPLTCPGVPSELLNPRRTWKDGKAYDEQANMLAGKFIRNFEKYAASTDPKVLKAGPKL